MIETMPFGATGHESTRVDLWRGCAGGRVTQSEAGRCTPRRLLEHGINHIDTAASYGESELPPGPGSASTAIASSWRPRRRSANTGPAREQIRRSLERLGVDHVDLIQLHCLVHPDEWDVALGEDCVLRAAVEARDEGLVRFIGVTGHGLHGGCYAPAQPGPLRVRFGAAAVQPCAHAGRPVFAVDFERGARDLPRAQRGRADDQGLSRCGPWGSKEASATTWYEPLVEQPDIDLAVHWVLGEPGVFLNSAGDLAPLPRVLAAAERFGGACRTRAAMARLLAPRGA